MTIPFGMMSKFTVKCFTDHSPLTWVKHTSGKGPVSQFVLDNLSIIDYDIYYIKGPDNETADALSRYPMLGPQTLTQQGRKAALHTLLTALVGSNVNTNKLWFYAQKDTNKLLIDTGPRTDTLQKELILERNHFPQTN